MKEKKIIDKMWTNLRKRRFLSKCTYCIAQESTLNYFIPSLTFTRLKNTIQESELRKCRKLFTDSLSITRRFNHLHKVVHAERCPANESAIHIGL